MSVLGLAATQTEYDATRRPVASPCRASSRPRGLDVDCRMCGRQIGRQSKAFCSYACAAQAKTRPWQERFWAKVDRRGADDCWPWNGSRGRYGHGSWRAGVGAKHEQAHRVAYELLVGPIPEGLTLDHLCRYPPCVNPAHMEPVTIGVNVLRGLTITAANAAKTHCKRGHEFTPENTYRQGNSAKRGCKACRLVADRESKRRTYIPSSSKRSAEAISIECANGHPRTPENTYVYFSGGRRHVNCRICNRAATARRKGRSTSTEGVQ